jgi:tRNA modification GTPase
VTAAVSTQSHTFAAILTPRGRGAVATIGFMGDADLIDSGPFRAANRRPLAAQELGRIVYGRWGDEPAEDVVLCRVDERTVEINCHGGDAATRRILEQLAAAGCEIVSWSEWLRRTRGPLDAEFAEALSRATTERTAAILLEQSAGVFRGAITDLLRALPESRDAWQPVMRAKLDALLARAEFGRHLTEPWIVVLAGRPNVGKSSLINALLGYDRSIVFDQPGTTRDVVHADTAFDGWPVRLSDTAGLRRDADELESAGIARAHAQLAAADCRVLLLDISRAPEPLDFELLATVPRDITVAHKTDLPPMWSDALPEGALAVSSVTRAGVDELIEKILARLIPDVPSPGTAIPVSPRLVQLLQEARDALNGGRRDDCRDALEALIM